MNLLASLLLAGAPFEIPESYIEPLKPTGMVDKAVLKGHIPWCKGAFEGETGWEVGRLHRTIESRGGSWAVKATQLCEAPDEPTWIRLAQRMLQMLMNENNFSQDEAIAALEKAMVKAKKEKENEGKEPSDEERFAFGDDDFNVEKAAPGIAEVKPGKMGWCEGVKVSEKWDARRISRTVGGKYGIDGTISGARQVCLRPNDETWIKEGLYILQKWMNWTGLSQADAEKSLAARINAEKFAGEMKALCKALELSPEISGSAKAFGEAQLSFFGCSGRDQQTLWQEQGSLPKNITFYVDPQTNPPNEIVRIVMLYDTVWSPGSHDYPSKDASENTNLLRYAVAANDFASLDRATLEKQLAAAPYNDYARIVAIETFAHISYRKQLYETAVEKLVKGDADYAAILRGAAKKGWTQWTALNDKWKAEIARSNAFEAKLSNPSRKVLKGCEAELMPDARKLVSSYKLSDYNDVKARLSSDPAAMLLFDRLAVCSAYEKTPGVSGVLDQLVKNGRDLRGPRSLAYYAIVDALAEALKDRPKLLLQLANFHWSGGGSLASMYSGEFRLSGGLGQGPDRDEPKGVVASVSKVAEGMEIKFKHSKYTYPEQDCVDDKFHPLKIDSGGHIHYSQKCKYTGKMVTVDTTPRPIIVAPHMATNVKPGVYVVGAEQGADRGKSGAFMGIVHFTKAAPKDKKITTFYGFDL